MAVRRSGFLDPNHFPFTAMLVANRSTFTAEFSEIPSEQFDPWVEPSAYHGEWRVFGICHMRADFVLRAQLDRNARWCRRTREIVQRIPGLIGAGISWLGPASHILAHVDERCMPSLRCHVTLATDRGARMRVGDETREFGLDGCLLFDSSDEHEVVHEGKLPRVSLIVEVARDQAFAPLRNASASGERSSAL